MIEFLKQRKIVIIIGILVIILVSWKIYDTSNFNIINSNEFTENNLKEEKIQNKEEEEKLMAVHITGEVRKPGVVKIKEDSRIEDVIKAAGGLTENANISNVNLAYIVEDGMKIRIPSQDEKELEEEYITKESGKGVIISDEVNDNSEKSLSVNINIANQEELENLPGIGPSIANKIIEYRNQNGRFKNIEDIKNVTGIGESKFEKIKDFIKVK